jgi:hypothetical protein
VGVEHLNDFGKIEQGAGEPINLVDHNDVHLRSADVSQKALEGGPFKRSAGIAAIVIVGRQGHPAFVLLT